MFSNYLNDHHVCCQQKPRTMSSVAQTVPLLLLNEAMKEKKKSYMRLAFRSFHCAVLQSAGQSKPGLGWPCAGEILLAATLPLRPLATLSCPFAPWSLFFFSLSLFHSCVPVCHSDPVFHFQQTEIPSHVATLSQILYLSCNGTFT